MWTHEDIVDKVAWEGGWAGFMEYGGPGEDEVPDDILAEWNAVIDAWKQFEWALRDLERKLPEIPLV